MMTQYNKVAAICFQIVLNFSLFDKFKFFLTDRQTDRPTDRPRKAIYEAPSWSLKTGLKARDEITYVSMEKAVYITKERSASVKNKPDSRLNLKLRLCVIQGNIVPSFVLSG